MELNTHFYLKKIQKDKEKIGGVEGTERETWRERKEKERESKREETTLAETCVNR